MQAFAGRPGAAAPVPADLCGPSGRAAPAGRPGGRVRTAAGQSTGGGGRKGDKQRQELQDLLIDPAYDPLFDGIDEDSGYSSGADPFQASKPKYSREKRQAHSNKKGRSGRPVGSARPKTSFMEEASEDYFRRRQKEREAAQQEEMSVEEQYREMFGGEEEPVGPKTAFELQLAYMRWNFMQQQQEEVMEMHHRHRATEVSAYAQATALAHLMEHFERQDEFGEDTDPLPSWIRAKKMIAANWPLMERLAGDREQTMRSVREFQGMTPERQHLIDTWDESLYAGQPDPEEAEYEPDYMDQFLRLAPPAASAQEPALQPAAAGAATVAAEVTGEDLMNDLLPDLDGLDD